MKKLVGIIASVLALMASVPVQAEGTLDRLATNVVITHNLEVPEYMLPATAAAKRMTGANCWKTANYSRSFLCDDGSYCAVTFTYEWFDTACITCETTFTDPDDIAQCVFCRERYWITYVHLRDALEAAYAKCCCDYRNDPDARAVCMQEALYAFDNGVLDGVLLMMNCINAINTND